MSEPAVDLLNLPPDSASNLARSERLGRIVIDSLAHEVSIGGSPVALTPREFSLLAYFVAHTGRLLTRRQIVQAVWGERYEGGARTVDIHISRLRRKLGTDLQLDTLRRVGYRLGSASIQAATESET